MYNRYMRNDDGSYTRVMEEEPGRRAAQGQPASGGENRSGQQHAFGGSQGPGGQEASDRQERSSGGDRDHGENRAPTERQGHGEGHSSDAQGPFAGGWDHEGQAPPHQGQRPFYQSPPPPSGGRGDGLTGFLRHFLDQWHLDSVDTGDLLLLGLLFFLFREDADEELLVALGLLLIL